MNTTCCEGSTYAQELIRDGHDLLFGKLDAVFGIPVDVFVVTYACTNGLDHAQKLVPEYYGNRLKRLEVVDRASQKAERRGKGWMHGQKEIFARGVELVDEYQRTNGFRYDHVLLARLDGLVKRFNPCFLDYASIPLNGKAFGSQIPRDAFFYVPGKYVSCLARHARTTWNEYYTVRDVMRLAGHTAEEAERITVLPGDGACPYNGPKAPIIINKLTAAAKWQPDGWHSVSHEPRDGDCACGAVVIADKALGGIFNDPRVYLRENPNQFPPGGCAHWRPT